MSWQVWAILVGICVLFFGGFACAFIWPWTAKYLAVAGILLVIGLLVFLNTLAEAWRH